MRGRLSVDGATWRVWRVLNLYAGAATVQEMAAFEGVSTRRIKAIRAAGVN